MYYSNINNPKVELFHKLVKCDFSIKKTDLINSNLCFVESIGNMKKIYPLFYCDSIISTNANDKIIGAKVILTDNAESIYTFKSEKEAPIKLYVDLFEGHNVYAFDEHLNPVGNVIISNVTHTYEVETDATGFAYYGENNPNKLIYNNIEYDFNTVMDDGVIL